MVQNVNKLKFLLLQNLPLVPRKNKLLPLKGLFHPAFLARVVTCFLPFSRPMKMATTKEKQETTRARHGG